MPDIFQTRQTRSHVFVCLYQQRSSIKQASKKSINQIFELINKYYSINSNYNCNLIIYTSILVNINYSHPIHFFCILLYLPIPPKIGFFRKTFFFIKSALLIRFQRGINHVLILSNGRDIP